ncbi:unnamed protein product [Ceutorhynchus assimilis]|uniref:ETS domain-containing protein n=1 Tax=Ceutorhynchus assimilis TaxID=467358 RepID=A0A9N9MMS9_9CUCU|nr:unnamed protein product [Ceutorhynchus assimilis]
MNKSNELQPDTYFLSLNKHGQKICTSQSDPTKKYVLDDHGFMTEYLSKSENDDEDQPQADENSLSKDSETDTINHLGDPSQLGMMHLDTAQDFEEKLMNQLDSDIMMNIDVNPSCHYFMEHMDIRDPLSKLKKILEKKLNTKLNNFKFTLQDTQILEDHKNLVDQCVQGKGIVQVNIYVLLASKRINIMDVLKPADDYVHKEVEEEPETEEPINLDSENEEVTEPVDKNKKIVQWQVDTQYKKVQEKLNIPLDPVQWNRSHVKHWLQWAVRKFDLLNLKLSDWDFDGQKLYELTLHDFKKLVPNDPGDIFWTHLELLRRMKLVAIKRTNSDPLMEESPPTKKPIAESDTRSGTYHHHSIHSTHSCPVAGNRFGNNGQIQLWQFLLELLTSREYHSIIQWTGNGSEFRLCQPDLVAQLWGDRKNKPLMNYEKLSRALRYYYDGDMISKVPGRRFVYKFVCDLKQMLGYNAMELANLVKYGNPMI